MAMIGGERAELAACADRRVSPALQRRMDDVFATLFAGRRPLDTEDADDRMRISPPRPERIAITAADAAPRWADAEPGEVPAIVAG